MTVSADDPVRTLAQSEINALLQLTTERRTSQRYPYQVLQELTPLCNGILADSRHVQCCNISRGGIAFLLESTPDFDEFHLELKQGNVQLNVRGRVLATQEIRDKTVLVRSKFVERLQPLEK